MSTWLGNNPRIVSALSYEENPVTGLDDAESGNSSTMVTHRAGVYLLKPRLPTTLYSHLPRANPPIMPPVQPVRLA
jgi:hypothetical protein